MRGQAIERVPRAEDRFDRGSRHEHRQDRGAGSRVQRLGLRTPVHYVVDNASGKSIVIQYLGGGITNPPALGFLNRLMETCDRNVPG